jgi:hypothetical protein
MTTVTVAVVFFSYTNLGDDSRRSVLSSDAGHNSRFLLFSL